MILLEVPKLMWFRRDRNLSFLEPWFFNCPDNCIIFHAYDDCRENGEDSMRVLVTGTAGFIGFHVARYLVERGHSVVGIDNLTDYYDVQLKEDRLRILKESDNFEFRFLDISDRNGMPALFNEFPFERVVHLAAQPGVRHSIENPDIYVDTNIVGFLNVLEGCRDHSMPHLVYASSSSVYGANTKVPFTVTDNVDHPISLYGATKRANELMAHAYSHLFDMPTTGLRLFTVYGPWGRPDMAYFLFTKAIVEGKTIDLYNRGDMKRDFTYIDDVVEVIVQVLDIIPESSKGQERDNSSPCAGKAPFRIYNVGRHDTVYLKSFIELLEEELGRKAIIELLPMQSGDVPETYADVSSLEAAIGRSPKTSIQEGIRQFIQWFKEYY